jgi:hypothetical protein
VLTVLPVNGPGIACAVTFSVADAEVPSLVAVMTALNASPLYGRYKELVPTVNVALVAPSGMTMLGVDAARSVFELVRLIRWPPAGAGALMVTVPSAVPPVPPVIVAGLSVTETTGAAFGAAMASVRRSPQVARLRN